VKRARGRRRGVRKLVWLAEQLFTSLSPSLSLSLPLFLSPSLYSALYSAEMTGGKLYCSEFVSIGAPLRGEAGGRAEQALSQRPRLQQPAPPPPAPSCPSLPSFPSHPPPPPPPFKPFPCSRARSEIQIQASYSQRLGEEEHQKARKTER